MNMWDIKQAWDTSRVEEAMEGPPSAGSIKKADQQQRALQSQKQTSRGEEPSWIRPNVTFQGQRGFQISFHAWPMKLSLWVGPLPQSAGCQEPANFSWLLLAFGEAKGSNFRTSFLKTFSLLNPLLLPEIPGRMVVKSVSYLPRWVIPGWRVQQRKGSKQAETNFLQFVCLEEMKKMFSPNEKVGLQHKYAPNDHGRQARSLKELSQAAKRFPKVSIFLLPERFPLWPGSCFFFRAELFPSVLGSCHSRMDGRCGEGSTAASLWSFVKTNDCWEAAAA